MLNSAFYKLYKIPILLALLSVMFYVSFAYGLERSDTIKLVTFYSALFFLFYTLVKTSRDHFRFLVVLAFIFRIIFLFALPNLSQDFFRFIWDGRMLLEGLNPYLYTPESFIKQGVFPINQAQELYHGMGELNGSHFTNYPPIKQFIFAIAGLFAGHTILGSAMIFRILIIAADFGTLYFGSKLLKRFKLNKSQIFWYLLNPFIIIELTGNLHFEGIMIFFFIWSLYLLSSGKWQWAAIVLGLSISVKLIPLMFLPLFYHLFLNGNFKESLKNYESKLDNENLNLRKLILFYFLIGITVILLFLPFYSSELIENYTTTVGLWFQTFEFNASLYYVARAVGYWLTGYNQIAVIGSVIPLVVIMFILVMSIFKKNNTVPKLMVTMLFTASLYYFCSTTVHPWYLAILLILSIFTTYKFPLVWTFMIILSYVAYGNNGFHENMWYILLEYAVVYGVLIWELSFRKSHQTLSS